MQNKGQLLARIENDFVYHKPFGMQQERYAEIRERAKDLARYLVEATPLSREQSVALTKLEECVFFANAAIARNEKLAATMGKEPGTANISLGLGALASLVDSANWNAILIGAVGGRAETKVMWVGAGERHPRDLARLVMREVFDVDPDDRRQAASFFTVDMGYGDDEEDD